MACILQRPVGGHESGLPIVTVEDVPRSTEAAGQFQRGPREEDESLGVVGVIARSAVERGSVEKLVVGDEIGIASGPGNSAPQDAGHRPPRADRHLELDAGGLDREPLGVGVAMAGHHQGDLAAEVGQCSG